MHFDATTASCSVHVYKAGALSAFGHDLDLVVTGLSIDVDLEPPHVRVEIDPTSLRVRDEAVSSKDRRTIERHVVVDVLHAEHHRQISFESQDIRLDASKTSAVVVGELALHGVRRPLTVDVRREGSRWVSECDLDQRTFGIEPFSAMLGALRVQPRVRVRVEVPVFEPRASTTSA